MKHRWLFYTSSLLAVFLPIVEGMPHQSGAFFSENEIKEILQRVHSDEDLIVLRDGTKILGKVFELPEVRFPYGVFPLKMQDVAAIAFAEGPEKIKIQMITHDGYSFITDTSSEQIPLIQSSPEARRSIGIDAVSHILLSREFYACRPKPSRLHMLELNSGNHFPVLIAEEKISLSNGWKEFSLRPEEILNVSFDGGMYGTIQGSSGKEKELGFSFVTDSFLRVKVLNCPQIVGIPWNDVRAIRKQKVPAVELEEFIVGKERSQPPLRFDPKSAHVEPEAIVWIEDPQLSSSSHSASIDLDKEEMLIAMLPQEKPRPAMKKKWAETASEKDEEGKDQLLKRQNDLVAHIEFEITRSNMLHASLEAVDQMRKLALESLREESALSEQLQAKIRYLADCLEVEREKRQKTEDVLPGAQSDLWEKEREIAGLKRQYAAFRESVQKKWQEYNQIQKQQQVLHRELLQKIALLEAEKESGDQAARERLNRELDVAVSQVGDLQGIMDRLKEALQKKERESAQFQDEAHGLNRELSREKERSAHLEDTVFQLKEDVQASLARNEDLESGLKQALEEMRILEYEVEQEQSDKGKREWLSRELDVAVSQVGDLQGIMDRLKEALQKKERESAQFQDEADGLSRELSLEKERSTHLEDTVFQLKEDVQASLARNEDLENRLKQALEEMQAQEELSRELDIALSKISDAQGLVDQLKGVLREKEVEAVQLKGSLIRKERELAEAADAHAIQAEALVNEVQCLAQVVQEGAKEKSAYQKKARELENDNRELHNALAEIQELFSQSQEEIEELNTRIGHLSKEAYGLNKELSQERGRSTHLQDTVFQLREDVQASLARSEDLESSLNQAFAATQILEQQLTEAQEELADKDAQLEGLAELQRQYLFLSKKTEDFERERWRLHHQLDQAFQEQRQSAGQIQSLENAHEEMAARNAQLENALSQLRLEMENSSRDALHFEEQLALERHKNEEYKKQVDQLFPQFEREREKGFHLQREKETLSAHLREAKSALQAAEAREAGAQERFRHLTEEKHQLEKEKGRLTYQLKQEQNRLKEQRELAGRLIQNLNAQPPAYESMGNGTRQEPLDGNRSRGAGRYQMEGNDYRTEGWGQAEESEGRLISFKGTHVVAEGENLNNISMRYYNSPDRWRDIYQANRDVIPDINHLQAGISLVIPD